MSEFDALSLRCTCDEKKDITRRSPRVLLLPVPLYLTHSRCSRAVSLALLKLLQVLCLVASDAEKTPARKANSMHAISASEGCPCNTGLEQRLFFEGRHLPPHGRRGVPSISSWNRSLGIPVLWGFKLPAHPDPSALYRELLALFLLFRGFSVSKERRFPRKH